MYYIKRTTISSVLQSSATIGTTTRFFYNKQKINNVGMFGKATKKACYSYDLIECHNGTPTYESLVNFLISLKYSIEDEQAILRKKLADLDTKDEFSVYNDYCESCKELAKELINQL